MWSKLHGRKNDYILVINFKTFLAAIMCLWLPWMKARHSLEFSQNPFMIYNMAKFILTKPENSIGVFDSNGIFHFHNCTTANKIGDDFTLFRVQRNRYLNMKKFSKNQKIKETNPKENEKCDSEKKSCISFRPRTLDGDDQDNNRDSTESKRSHRSPIENIASNTKDFNLPTIKRMPDFNHISKDSPFKFLEIINDHEFDKFNNFIEFEDCTDKNAEENDNLVDMFYQPFKKTPLKSPYLIIDVYINDLETVSIPVYNSDNAEDLARKFSIQNHLKKEKELELKELIDEHIKNSLGRIDESENEDTTNNF